MEFEHPKYHKQIVEDLMNGKFILSKEIYFDELKNNTPYYESFFKMSFGHDFIINHEYAYLISSDTNENQSRDISIFFAIICYELDKVGRDFLDLLEYGDLSVEEIDNLFENSSYGDLISSNNQIKDSEARKRLLRAMSSRNIVERISDDRYLFTPARRVFLDFAKELAENKTNSNMQQPETDNSNDL